MPETWRDPKVDPPPKDGTPFALCYGDGAVIVKWVPDARQQGPAFEETWEEWECWFPDCDTATWYWCSLPEMPDETR